MQPKKPRHLRNSAEKHKKDLPHRAAKKENLNAVSARTARLKKLSEKKTREPIKGSLRGMTAYGHGSAESAQGRFEVQIQGTNRRYLEISLNLPKYLSSVETEIRKLIEERVARGQVNVSCSIMASAHQKIELLPNIALAKEIKRAYEKMAREIKVPFEFRLEYLLSEEGILLQQGEEKDKIASSIALKKALEGALLAFCEMKEEEGRVAAADFMMRLGNLKKSIGTIEEKSQGITKKLREKLQKRIAPFFDKPEDEERLLKEIVLYADRADISEEILRFKSLVSEFQKVVEKPLADGSETKGKRLDFLIQELMREINTLGAKAQEATIMQLVVDVKCELEKMREEVQNIE